MDRHLCFVYINSRDVVSVQFIANISENDEYLQGISLLSHDEGRLKTFRKDRVIEYFEDLNEAMQFTNDIIEVGEFAVNKPRPETFDIHFTGFKKDVKSELETLANNARMEVKKSVTKNLKLLCYGYNASQLKMDKARSMGVIILNEEKFRDFLETGDITDN
ncbi:hypothetical protein [Xenorhabdus bovienii]|uniref:BRCT domain-containing protein n=1 Tax=Xenorhabdus bovienii str. Intermedium TaxID=1379677 RepID=A0A077Q7W8_XENBV|nr:hypothetical protein [Xenorhabdus bovienii]CDH32367.1 conserved hypothetical protein [Xenorhabdus bovienii str. Intermedium]